MMILNTIVCVQPSLNGEHRTDIQQYIICLRKYSREKMKIHNKQYIRPFTFNKKQQQRFIQFSNESE